MGTKKGHFTKDDADRYTEKHLEICKWFVSNANIFARRFLFDRPNGKIDVILEKLITTPTGYIIGYADVLLSYRTDQGKNHLVLIEVKTSLGDQAEALRQLNTYEQYLPSITKKCLVHGDWRFKPWLSERDGEGLRDDIDMRRTYSSQGIYVVEYESLKNGNYNPHYCSFPTGRREVVISWCREPKTENGLVIFDVSGAGFDEQGQDGKAAGYFSIRPPYPPNFWKLLGFQDATADFKQARNVVCLVDVEHHASTEDGSAEEEFVALHTCDMSISIELKQSS